MVGLPTTLFTLVNVIYRLTMTLMDLSSQCFLGSEEYPRENEYKQYLSKHGGRSNASTSLSHTTYQV